MSESVADGQEHALDPRVVPLERVTGAMLLAVMAVASLTGLLVAWFVDDDRPAWLGWALTLSWPTMMTAAAWQVFSWPPRAYRHTSYRVDDRGIEIRRGVFWRAVINVPKSRVQHIDVSQGPVERRFGLGTLVLYTAGTDHAKVELAGLEHGRALAIRAHLLPSGSNDAV